jgi:hypothetical protein
MADSACASLSDRQQFVQILLRYVVQLTGDRFPFTHYYSQFYPKAQSRPWRTHSSRRGTEECARHGISRQHLQ